MYQNQNTMIKVFILVCVAMFTFNTHSQERSVRASYIVDQVWDEIAITTIAAKVPSPKGAPDRPKDARREYVLPAPPTEPEPVGHIDQHDYG